MSHLFAADGSLLLSVAEFIQCLDEDPSDRDNPEDFLKCNMYRLLPGRFPAQEQHTLPYFPAREREDWATVFLTVRRREGGVPWQRDIDSTRTVGDTAPLYITYPEMSNRRLL